MENHSERAVGGRLLYNREHLPRLGINLSPSSLLRLEAAGKFPKRVRIGDHSVAWLASEIHAHIEALAADREIAMNRKCAIICVRHFGKGAQDKAMKKGLGSTDFVGISRNQFGLARRSDGPRGFIVFHMKTNFERGLSMLFKMGDADGRIGEQPEISFEKFTDITADDFFAGDVVPRGPDQDEREVAKEYLLEALADGPKAAAVLKSQGEARAISASTLDRARKELGIITAKQGKIWNWSLPPE